MPSTDHGTPPSDPAIRLRWPSAPVLALAAVCVASWLAFALSGSLATYWLGVLTLVVPCAVLGRRRHWVAALAPVLGAALLGTELRGELGSVLAAPLNGVRVLDFVVLATTAGVASSSAELRRVRSLGALWGVIWPWRWVLFTLIVLGFLWLANHAHTDQLAKTDLRLIFLGGGTFYVARATVPGHEREFVMGLVTIGALTACKAIALHVSDLWAIGTYDRAQATQMATEPKRTILVGGDTLMILVPGAAVALVTRLRFSPLNVALLAASTLCGVAILLSGTRSSLLVACVMAVIAPVLVWPKERLPSGRQAVIILVTLGAIVLTATAVSGVGGRFTKQESQSQGLGFREDEIRTFSHLPKFSVVFGQGLGGRFTSHSSSGYVVETAWSHVLPVWVGLKLGLLGLAILTAVGGLALWRTLRRSRAFGPRTGALLLGGLLLMSLTIGRAALPEGVILLACCFILLGWGVPSDRPKD